ncbi:MAG: hypothetical protein SGCHY_005346 [Lobulomycetales sp.]
MNSAVEVQDISGQGKGLVNRDGPISPQSLLLSVPLEACWSVPGILEDAVFLSAVKDGEFQTALDPERMLSLYLLYVRDHIQQYPERREHLENLPKTYENALFYTPEQLVTNCSFDLTVSHLLKQVEADYVNVCGLIVDPVWRFTLEDYKWALASIQSRSMDFLLDGQHLRLLVPFADFMNHSFSPNATHQLNLETKSVEIVAAAPIAKGEQIVISYGQVGNNRLLRIYGFIIDGNPFDSFPLYLQTDSSAPLYDRKKALMESAGLSIEQTIVPIFRSDPKTSLKPVMQYLRIQRADTEEALALVAKTRGADAVDPEMECQIAKSLLEALKEMFDNISIPDGSLEDQTSDSMILNALKVGSVEKSTIASAILELNSLSEEKKL